MSWSACAWALKQPCDGPGEKLLLICMANYADAAGKLWAGQERLAVETCQSERTVRGQLAVLESRGLITRRSRSNGKTRAFLTDVIVLQMGQSEGSEPAAEFAAGSDAESDAVGVDCVDVCESAKPPADSAAGPAANERKSLRQILPPIQSEEDKQPIREARVRATPPDFSDLEVAAVPVDWQPCEVSLGMLRTRGLPCPPPTGWVDGFVGHMADRPMRHSAIPGEFLKWAARQRGFDAQREKAGGPPGPTVAIPPGSHRCGYVTLAGVKCPFTGSRMRAGGRWFCAHHDDGAPTDVGDAVVTSARGADR